MANRPIFIPIAKEEAAFVLTKTLKFKWFPGMSIPQKQKSIASLHKAACEQSDNFKSLEVSSKSTEKIGVKLSAFNLFFQVRDRRAPLSVECAFQGSKVFEHGGPYTDLYDKSSLEAKRDNRLHESGRLIGFKFFDDKWLLEPKTAFYDWLYITGLNSQDDRIIKQLFDYSGFTDIEFNPKKSINCQAYAVALYIALVQRDLLEKTMRSKEAFLQQMKATPVSQKKEEYSGQGELFDTKV